MQIIFDEGYSFGLGVFETMSIVNNHVILIDYHLERLRDGASFLGITLNLEKEEIYDYMKKNSITDGVLKIIVSDENIIFQSRENIYTTDKYKDGFTTKISSILRNESSPFTYIKSLNYGDNILEKRLALQKGYDEPIFLNTRRELSEGATTNIFFIKNNEIITPKLSCGILNGTIRKYLINNYEVKETCIYPHEVNTFDEMFVTNSLMGIMPVYKFENHIFKSRKKSDSILNEYLETMTSL